MYRMHVPVYFTSKLPSIACHVTVSFLCTIYTLQESFYTHVLMTRPGPTKITPAPHTCVWRGCFTVSPCKVCATRTGHTMSERRLYNAGSVAQVAQTLHEDTVKYPHRTHVPFWSRRNVKWLRFHYFTCVVT